MGFVFIIIAVALAAGAIAAAKRNRAQNVAMIQWPTTAARVAASRWENRSTGTAESGKANYKVMVATLDYTVVGTAYSSRIERTEDKTGAAAKLIEGATVNVHYNPADPKQCAYEPAANVGSALSLVLWVLAVILGLIGLVTVFAGGHHT